MGRQPNFGLFIAAVVGLASVGGLLIPVIWLIDPLVACRTRLSMPLVGQEVVTGGSVEALQSEVLGTCASLFQAFGGFAAVAVAGLALVFTIVYVTLTYRIAVATRDQASYTAQLVLE